MKRSLAFLFFIALLACTQNLVAQTPIVQTAQGLVSGSKEDGIAVFRGVPFAAPPVGDLRWKAPQPAKAWKGVKDCTKFSASPIQGDPKPFLCWSEEFIAPPKPLSEDCLYLNVWTNDASKKSKKPVFVWIYGGGFSSGSSACAVYDGAEYAKRGIVFVSVNYRVGAIGFLAHPELTAEGGGTSGNYGIMDQVAALKWVKENIAVFGGDPDQVTIAGQSAGSMSINCLVATPAAKGLFQRAIAQSGGLFGGINFRGLKAAEETGMALQKKLGAKSLAEMRALPADSILHASSGAGGGLAFSPIMDGKFLPADPVKAFTDGNFNNVNLMTGWVTGDGGLFGSTKTDKAAFEKTVKERYGDKADKVLALMPHATDEEASASQANLTLVSFAVASAYRLAEFNRKTSYVYEFSHVPTDKPGFPNYGAFHTADVPFAMGNLHTWIRPWKPLDYEVEKTMSAYWVNFIKTGDPNGAGLPKWEPFNTGKIQEIGDATDSRAAIHKDLVSTMFK